MLDSCLFESRPDRGHNGGRKKPATLAISTVVHLLVAGALILVPLMQTQAVPPVALPQPVVSPGPPVRMIKLVTSPSSGRAALHPVTPALPDALIEPTIIPQKISYVEDVIDIGFLESLRPGPSTGPGDRLGPIGAAGIRIAVAPPTVAAPPQPPPDPPTPPPAPGIQPREPIRVASSLQKSLLIRQVEPVYPRLAIIAHVEGSVLAEARITQSGTIDSLRIISGNPLLTQAVIDAVKQWRYQPTLLNGEPIDVITTITVNFKLN